MAKRIPARLITPAGFSFVLVMFDAIIYLSCENLSHNQFFVNLKPVDKNFAVCYDFFNATSLSTSALIQIERRC